MFLLCDCVYAVCVCSLSRVHTSVWCICMCLHGCPIPVTLCFFPWYIVSNWTWSKISSQQAIVILLSTSPHCSGIIFCDHTSFFFFNVNAGFEHSLSCLPNKFSYLLNHLFSFCYALCLIKKSYYHRRKVGYVYSSKFLFLEIPIPMLQYCQLLQPGAWRQQILQIGSFVLSDKYHLINYKRSIPGTDLMCINYIKKDF